MIFYRVSARPFVPGPEVDRWYNFLGESFPARESLPTTARKWAMFGVGGFKLNWSGAADQDSVATGVLLPHWLLVLTFAIAPARWLMARRRSILVHHRLSAGLCLACGYDLRGTPDRCPECGRKIENPNDETSNPNQAQMTKSE
jgi:hypothetical protein